MASGADFELLWLQPDVSVHVAQFLYHSHSKGLSSPESPSVCLVDSVNRHVVFQVFSTPPDLHYYWNLLDYGFIMTIYDNGFALQVKRGLEAWRSWSSPGWKLLLLEDVASARDDLSPSDMAQKMLTPATETRGWPLASWDLQQSPAHCNWPGSQCSQLLESFIGLPCSDDVFPWRLFELRWNLVTWKSQLLDLKVCFLLDSLETIWPN